MKSKLCLCFFLLTAFLFAQHNNYELGLNYGESSPFRKNDDSYYNYNNVEAGIFFTKINGWKRNENDLLKKYWLIQPQIYLGRFEFISVNKVQHPFRGILYGGIKIQKSLEKVSLHTKFLIGSGYQTGYFERLPNGIFFTEKINLGIEFKKLSHTNPFIDVGVMHVSNGNFYKLNRGLEVFYIEVGIQLLTNK